MRSLYIVTIAFLALTVGYLIWQTVMTGGIKPTANQAELQLSDLPTRYCPTQIRVVSSLADRAEQTGQLLPVTSCRAVKLASLSKAAADAPLFYFKLPSALPFSLTAAELSSGVTFAPALGDVTGDGVIDRVDESRLAARLFSQPADPTFDLTADGVIDAEDLALVRLHQGVGATTGENGDRIQWEQIR